MQLKLKGVIAIMLAFPVMGCSYGSGLLGPGLTAPLSAADEAADDKQCQTTGYQIGTPAYDQCRQELNRQHVVAERYQATPSNAVPR